jgi:hypothetical protein
MNGADPEKVDTKYKKEIDRFLKLRILSSNKIKKWWKKLILIK